MKRLSAPATSSPASRRYPSSTAALGARPGPPSAAVISATFCAVISAIASSTRPLLSSRSGCGVAVGAVGAGVGVAAGAGAESSAEWDSSSNSAALRSRPRW